MYSSFQSAIKYISYYITASNGRGHGIHSPFVFDFIKNVLDDKTEYPQYKIVEKLRSDLLRNKTILSVDDLGAGSAVHKSNQRTISSLAKKSAKPSKYAQLLFRIAKKYQSKKILELGTSLGITTSYFALSDPASKVVTVEGSESIAQIANNNFKQLKLENVELIEGNFDDLLPSIVNQFPTIDLVFLDGNHRKEPTINYFKTVLPAINNYSVVIFDDIHWSKEMEEAWDYCKLNERVTLSIDLFFLGILFFRNEIKEKQHFTIRF